MDSLCQIQLDHFVPTESSPFLQQIRTEERTGNVASAQNGCAGTTLLSRQLKQNGAITRNNRTRDKIYSHLCSYIYFLVHKTF